MRARVSLRVLLQRQRLLNTTMSDTKIYSGYRLRVFISYKRNVFPDEDVALEVYSRLRVHHEIFIDQTMLVGTPWAQRIEEELRRTDFLLTFLSAESVQSEMVIAEIETAHRLGKLNAGKPAILPVRLAYNEALRYPLSAYLNHIKGAYWTHAADTDKLVDELLRVLSGGAELAGAIPLPTPVPQDADSLKPSAAVLSPARLLEENQAEIKARIAAVVDALDTVQRMRDGVNQDLNLRKVEVERLTKAHEEAELALIQLDSAIRTVSVAGRNLEQRLKELASRPDTLDELSWLEHRTTLARKLADARRALRELEEMIPAERYRKERCEAELTAAISGLRNSAKELEAVEKQLRELRELLATSSTARARAILKAV